MAISTNSIIHYTDALSTLKLIITEGFKITYCSEVLKLANNSGSRAAHPMISFCDIPLSSSKKHFNAYGKFGIGLSKSWAIKNGVNPVLYIDDQSLFAKSLSELLEQRRDKLSNLSKNQKQNILRIKAYAKNYSGHLIRKGVNDKNYKFYDEREWRLVPEKELINSAPFSVNLATFSKNKNKYNNRISKCRFIFSLDDISYIIVDKTKQIPKLTKFLRKVFSETVNEEEFDVLLSKICSTEQIENDY